MIWITVHILIAGAQLIRLGALSVLVNILVFSLKVVAGFIAAIRIFMHWGEEQVLEMS